MANYLLCGPLCFIYDYEEQTFEFELCLYISFQVLLHICENYLKKTANKIDRFCTYDIGPLVVNFLFACPLTAYLITKWLMTFLV